MVALPLLLFLATLMTTTLQGALMIAPAGFSSLIDQIVWAAHNFTLGLPFSIPLMSILVVHEMGHFVAAKLHAVPASLPFFIPIPPPFGFGTMGAIIGMRPARNANAIVDIGAAGPLAGLCVAIPVLIYGLGQSDVGPIPPGAAMEGNSLLYWGLKRVATGHWLPSGGIDVQLSQTALAGWFGLFVTMLNLIPIGQLDGGHVATAFFGGERYERVSAWLHRLLPLWALGNFLYVAFDVRFGGDRSGGGHAYGWPVALRAGLGVAIAPLVWALMLRLIKRRGRYHPPIDAEPPLSAGRRGLCILVAVVFFLIVMPWPFRMAEIPEIP